MKLVSIGLQNFQAHGRTQIPVSDFTILVGASSAGKTSVFRALQFFLYGEWDSTYPMDPEKATAVALEFEDGTKVIRLRKGTSNSAAIFRNGEVTKYKSFGATIPGIFNIMNVKPIDIGNKDVNLNFSYQDDAPFMLSESKPSKAQWLGRLYGAHVVNDMLRCMAKDKKNLDADKRANEEKLAKLKKEMLEYSGIEEQELALKECREYMLTAKKVKDIYDAYEGIRHERSTIKRDEWVLKIDATELKKQIEEYKLLMSVKAIKTEVDEDRAFIESNKKAMSLKPERMREALKLFQIIMDSVTGIKKVRASLSKMRQDRLTVMTKLAVAKKALGESMVLNGNCPVCGQAAQGIDSNHIADNIKKILGN
jgi:hypothetical protein